jgi:hypothetical protein
LGGRTGFTRQRPRPRCKVPGHQGSLPCARMEWPPGTVERSQRAHPQIAGHRGRCRRDPQGCGAYRHQASASKPDPRAEVDVGRGGGSRQLRRGRASLVVGVRAAAASIAARLIHPLSRRAGAPRGARPTGPEASGTHRLHAGPVGRGGQRAPAVTTSDRGTAGQVAGEAATRPLLRRRARDRVSQACGHDSGWFFFVRSAPRPGPRRPPLVAPARPVPPPVLGCRSKCGRLEHPWHRDSPGLRVGEGPLPQQIGCLLQWRLEVGAAGHQVAMR